MQNFFDAFDATRKRAREAVWHVYNLTNGIHTLDIWGRDHQAKTSTQRICQMLLQYWMKIGPRRHNKN
jgi:hypothetical protein